MRRVKGNAGWIVMILTFVSICVLEINAMPSLQNLNDLPDLRRIKREPQYYEQQYGHPYGNGQTSNFGGGAMASAGRVALTYAGKQIVSAAGNEAIDRNGLLDTSTSGNNYGGFLAGGAAGGVAIGAAVGSVVPGLGTALGAAGGAILGSGAAYLSTKIIG